MLRHLFTPFLISALVALAAGWLLVPLLQRLKVGQHISEWLKDEHQAKQGTPTMGGFIILMGVFVTLLLYPAPSTERGPLLAVAVATVAFGLIGFLDDYLIIKRGRNLGLRAREKMAAQIVVGLGFTVWYALTDPAGLFPESRGIDGGKIALGAYHLLILVGMSNAVNLTDGLDGLAAGVTLPVWITMGAVTALGAFASGLPLWLVGGVSNHGLVIFCAAFAGATLGYLWYNAHPARVFMGDTGSLAIGGGMAAAAIVLHLEWLLLIFALVPIAEALSVMIQVASFKTTGRRVFKMSPVHHHFTKSGIPETRVVAQFAVVSSVCCALALALVFWR